MSRLVSLSAREMRHGRKSKSKGFTRYKRYIGVDAGILSAIQGNRARFRGLEKNRFHLQAVAVVNNFYVLNALFADREAA